jgi:hypothetical protein
VTATITVNPPADTPSVTNATTNEDTQSTTGLVSRNAADGAEVTHFKITSITGGTLERRTTQIANDTFITAAEGGAGLKFTPRPTRSRPGTSRFRPRPAPPTWAWWQRRDGHHHGQPVADTPSVTNATTNEDTQSTTGLVISRNAADGAG